MRIGSDSLRSSLNEPRAPDARHPLRAAGVTLHWTSWVRRLVVLESTGSAVASFWDS